MTALDPSVYFQAYKAFASTAANRFKRALITFVPTGGLVAGFTELSLAVTQSNWKILLRSRGGKDTDLIWKAVDEFWAPAGASLGATGQNPAKALKVCDKLIIGRRTHAEPTKWTVLVTGGLDGTYTLTAKGYAGVATFEADTNTAAEIRAGLIAAWNAQTDLAAASTAVTNGAASLDISTDIDGIPFIVEVSSTGSPLTLTLATADGDYEADLDAIVADNAAAGTAASEDRDFWAIHDLQLDDKTNRQGVEWCIAQKTADARKSYCYFGESYQSTIPDANVTNDQASTLKTLLTPLADENNDRGVGLLFVEDIKYAVPGWLGRCLGYNLGAINWAQREIINVPPVELDDEAVATLKYFNFVSPESPNGNLKWGYLGSGRYIDDLWAEDILTWEGQTALLRLLVGADALTYTDEGGIAQGRSAIIQALLKYAGPDYRYAVPDSIDVIAGKRSAQPAEDFAQRRFVDYQISLIPSGLINRYGDLARPIILTISVA